MQMTELFVINIDSGGPQKQEILAHGAAFLLYKNNKQQTISHKSFIRQALHSVPFVHSITTQSLH
jgi:hypothetical protein